MAGEEAMHGRGSSPVREEHGVVPRALGAGPGRPYARGEGAWPGVPLRLDGEAVG